MEKTVLVSISPSEKKETPQKKRVRHILAALNLKVKGLDCVGLSALYRLEGDFSQGEAEKIAREVLCDNIVETYALDARPADPKTVFADVWYKPGVTDAVGVSVLKALRDLKVSSVQRAFSGTRYAFKTSLKSPSPSSPPLKGGENAVDTAVGKIEAFVTKQLLNPLVQECRINRF